MQKFLKLSVGLDDTQTTLVTAASLLRALLNYPREVLLVGCSRSTCNPSTAPCRTNRSQSAVDLVRRDRHAVYDAAA
jgi:hypothetical protein